MTDAVFRVRFAGPLVSVQDGGRPGLMRYGVPASGPMDRKALIIANTALGKPAGAPGIEVSLGGLVMDLVEGAVTLAIAGGGFVVEAGTQRLGSWAVFTLHAGDTLTIRRGPWGAWTCLAFAGDLDTPTWLGSASTHALSGFGGGRLVAGATLTVRNTRLLEDDRPLPCPVSARPRNRLHAVFGPQGRCFVPAARSALFGAPYQVTDAADRMGVRLRGSALELNGALSIPSEPILRGSVQVTGDGMPAVLMADHQTTGGYPKIATVLSDDLDGFAQLRPNDPVGFVETSPERAVAIARQRAQSFATYLSSIVRRASI